MLRPHDLWTIAHRHNPAPRPRPHGDLVPRGASRTPGDRRRRLAALALLPAAALIPACGSNDAATSAYCGAVEDAKPSFVALQTGEPESFDEVFATFHDLAQDSPGELDADWKVLDEAAKGVEDALDKAGLDFDAVTAGQLPAGIEPKELQAVMDGLEVLASQDVMDAADSIEEHALAECDVKLAAG
jgi:hypothetical protein